MSKRFAEPQYNEFKKRKLDCYPNSESLPSTSKVVNPVCTQSNPNFHDEDDIWGDDDDEILLLASQACEQVEQCDMSSIANYTLLMKPSITSTQKSVAYADHSTAKSTIDTNKFYGTQNGTFRIPTNCAAASVVASARTTNECDPVVDGQFQRLIKELRTSKVASDKLRHEHEMLTDKFLLKEGEVSILRTQIKNLQSQSDAARMQRLKVEEKKEMVWNEKLLALERENQSLKTQIEFKNLDEFNLKERCRLLESSKIKLTEPRSKWPGFSQKTNTFSVKTDRTTQTDPAKLLILTINPVCSYPILEAVPKSIFHHIPSKEVPILFSSNKESLFVEHSSFSSIRKRILNEFGVRVCRNRSSAEVAESNVKFDFIYEDISKLMEIQERGIRGSVALSLSLRIFLMVKEYLLKTLKQLKELSAKVTSQTIREMDEKYLNIMAHNPDISAARNLFDDSSWCQNEQSIDTRRLVAVLGIICQHVTALADYIFGIKSTECLAEELLKSLPFCREYEKDRGKVSGLIALFTLICKRIGYIGCSHLYPGLLTSISMALKHSTKRIHNTDIVKIEIIELIKELVLLRPNARVLRNVLSVLRHLSTDRMFLQMLCNCKNSESCSMVLDYSQGVALYNSDTCFLQVLCCQVEIWVVNHTEASHIEGVFHMTRSLVDICHSASHGLVSWAGFSQDNVCGCSARVFQCVTVSLHRCAGLYETFHLYLNDENLRKRLNAILRAALLVLATCDRREPHSGDYLMFLSIASSVAESLQLKDEHREALEVLNANISPLAEDSETPSKEAEEIWEESFQNFFITD